jgi:hypothetical protein
VTQVLRVGPDTRTTDGRVVALVLPSFFWRRAKVAVLSTARISPRPPVSLPAIVAAAAAAAAASAAHDDDDEAPPPPPPGPPPPLEDDAPAAS